MDIARKILAQPGSKVPSVEETLPTLCNRLQHATLSSDRKSAILGLKSFSRQYRESVVEYGLRPLVTALKRDFENADITKAILETLLILFIRGEGNEDMTRSYISHQSRVQNGKYPSPLLIDDVNYDQFSLWIADALTQDPSTFELVLTIIQDNDDFHIKLYSIQLLEAVVSARASRAKDCLLTIPTSTSVLVSLLKDPRDPIRNEAILLLMAIVKDNFNIQKLVAFENTFDILFDIIQDEIGIRGSLLVQDCLSLIHNLLQYNASNQKYFIETQGIPRLNELMSEPLEEAYEDDLKDSEGNPIPIPPIHWTDQRLQNMNLALDICKSLVSDDNESLAYNQEKLTQAGVLFTVLRLTFSPNVKNETRLSALLAVCDIIRGNNELQIQLESIDVPYIDPSLPLQLQTSYEPIPVIISLINWALCINSVHCFDLRVAASKCLHAYMFNNDIAKRSFLLEQMESYKDPAYFDKLLLDENEENNFESGNLRPAFANIFSVLMDYDTEVKINPYRLWFAAVIVTYIIEDDENDVFLDMMTNFKTGDESTGEEVLGSIQAISGSLVTTLENYDERVPIGYLMLLSIWLYENQKAVDEFLSDPSVVRSILTYLSKSTDQSILVQGVAAFFIGIVFEFSSKESPISRVSLHGMIVQSLGKANFSLKVRQLKENPLFRNFDENFNFLNEKEESGLPELYFVPDYVNLVKDNYNRISKALLQDPNFETIKKISYDDFQELNQKYQELESSLSSERIATRQQEETLNKVIEELNAQYNEAQARLEEKSKELEKFKLGHSGIESDYNLLKAKLGEIEKLKEHFEDSSKSYYKELSVTKKMASNSDGSMKKLLMELEKVSTEKKKLEDGINKMTRDLFQLQKQKQISESNLRSHEKEIQNLKKELIKVKKDHDLKAEKLLKTNKDLELRVRELSEKLVSESKKAGLANALSKDLQTKNSIEAQNNEMLMNKLRSAASTYNELKKAKLEVENEVRFLKAKVASLELGIDPHPDNGQLSSLEGSQGDSQSKMAEFRQAFETLTLNNLALEAKQIEMEEEIRTLQLDQTEEQEAYEALIVELENKIKELSAENKKLLEAVATLEDTNKQLVTSKDSIDCDFQKYKEAQEAAFSAKETEIADYKEEMTRQRESFELKAADLDKKLEEKMEESNKVKSELDSQLAKLSEVELEHRSNFSKLELKYDDIKHELETKVVEYNSAVERLSQQEQQLSEMHEQQKGRVDEYEQKLSEVRDALGLKLKELEEARSQLKQAEFSLNELKTGYAKEREKSETKTKELESMLGETQKQLELSVSPEDLEDIKKQTVNEYNSKLSDARLQLELKNQAYQKLEIQLQQSNTSVDQLKGQLNSQSTEYKIKLEEFEDLSASYSELKLERDNLAKEHQEAQSGNALHLSQTSAIETNPKIKDLETILAAKELQVKSLEVSERGLRQELSLLSEKCMSFEHSIDVAGENQRALESHKFNLENELSTLQGNFRQLQEAHSALMQDISTREETSKSQSEAMYSALVLEREQEIEKAKSTISTIEKELAQTKSKYDQVQKSLEDLESEVLLMKKKQEEVAKEFQLATLSHQDSISKIEQIKELEKQLASSKEELDTTKAALEFAKETVGKHENDVKEFESSYLEVASILEKTKESHENLKAQLTTLESEHKLKLDNSNSELAKSNEMISELKGQEEMHLKEIEVLQEKITSLNNHIDNFNEEKTLVNGSPNQQSLNLKNGTVLNADTVINGNRIVDENFEAKLQAEIAKLKGEIESKSLELQKVIGEKEAFSQSAVEAEKDNSNLHVEIETVSNRLEQADNEIIKLKDVIKAKEELLIEKEAAIADLEEENDSVTDMMEKLNIVKFQLEGELKDIIKRTNPELLEDKENQIIALKNDLMLKIESLGLKDIRIEKLQGKLEARVKDYEDLSNEINGLKEDISIKDEEIKVYEAQIEDMQWTLSKNSKTISDLNSTCSALKEDNSKLESALASFKEEIVRLTRNFEELQKSYSSESKKANEKETHFSTLGEKLKEAEGRVIQLSLDYQNKVEAIESERQAFTKQVNDLQSKYSLTVKEWETKLNKAEATNLKRISGLQSENAALEDRLEATHQELSTKELALKQSAHQFSELEEKHSSLLNETSVATVEWESKLSKQEGDFRNEISTLEKDKTALSIQLQKKLEELLQESSKLAKCTLELSTLKSELKKTIEEKAVTIDEWEKRLINTEELHSKAISVATSNLEASRDQVEGKLKELLNTREKLALVNEELLALKEEFKNSRESSSNLLATWETKFNESESARIESLLTVNREKDLLSEELSNVLEDLHKMSSTLSQVKESLVIVETALRESEKEHVETVQELQTELEAANSAFNSNGEMLRNIELEKVLLSQELENKVKDLAASGHKLSGLNEEMLRLRMAYDTANDIHNDSLNELKSTFLNQQTLDAEEIKNLTSQKAALEQQIEEKLQELADLTINFNQLKELESTLTLKHELNAKEIADLKDAKAALEVQLEAKLQELEDLTTNFNQLKELESTLTLKHELNAKEIADLKDEKAALEVQLEAKLQELADVREEHLLSREEVERNSKKLISLENDLASKVKSQDEMAIAHQHEIEKAHQASSVKLEQKELEVTKLQLSLTELSNSIKELNADSNSNDQRLKLSEQEKNGLIAELKSKREEFSLLTKEKLDTDELNKALEEQGRKASEKASLEISNLNAELEKQKGEILTLLQQVKMAKAELSKNESEVILLKNSTDLAEASERVQILENQLNKAQDDYSVLKGEYEVQQETLNNLKSERKELVVELDALNDSKIEYERIVADWKVKYDTSITAHEEEIQEVRAETHKLLEDLLANRELISSLKEKYNALENEIDSSQREASIETQDNINRLQGELSQLNEVALGFRNEALQLSDTLASLRTELSQYKEQLVKEINDQKQKEDSHAAELQRQENELTNEKDKVRELTDKVGFLEFEVLDKEENVHILEEQLKKLFESKESIVQQHDQSQDEYKRQISQLERENMLLKQNVSQESTDDSEEMQRLRAQNEKLRDGLIKVKGLLMAKSESEHELEEVKQSLLAKDAELEVIREESRMLKEQLARMGTQQT